MAGFLDFAEIKKNTTYAQVIQFLGLKMKQQNPTQWRGPCPRCNEGGDRALVVTEGKGFYCFAGKEGGDQISLVAHIRAISIKQAAQELVPNSTVPSTVTVKKSTVPESGNGDETKKFAPLTYLEPEHMAVDAIGFDTDFARKHGIGFANKGTMRGFVLIPFRDEQGNLLGYIGVTEAKLPTSFTPNGDRIVPFNKTA